MFAELYFEHTPTKIMSNLLCNTGQRLKLCSDIVRWFGCLSFLRKSYQIMTDFVFWVVVFLKFLLNYSNDELLLKQSQVIH